MFDTDIGPLMDNLATNQPETEDIMTSETEVGLFDGVAVDKNAPSFMDLSNDTTIVNGKMKKKMNINVIDLTGKETLKKPISLKTINYKTRTIDRKLDKAIIDGYNFGNEFYIPEKNVFDPISMFKVTFKNIKNNKNKQVNNKNNNNIVWTNKQVNNKKLNNNNKKVNKKLNKKTINKKNATNFMKQAQEKLENLLCLENPDKFESNNINSSKYKLVGAVYHLGDGDSGHYVTDIIKNGQWKHYNQQTVKNQDYNQMFNNVQKQKCVKILVYRHHS